MARYVGYKIGKVHENHTVSDYYCGRCGYPVTDHDSYCPECGGAFRECDADSLEEENLQLRQRVDKLIRILNNDYDLCIQWDGLRKFWYVGLTDEGVRKRDERDAEVGLLRDKNAKLRELVRDMWRDGMCDCDEQYTCAECEYGYHERMRELGIEVES